MAKTKKQKTGSSLSEAERREQHRKNLDAMQSFTSKKTGGKRILSLSYPGGTSKGKLWRFFQGMGDVLVVSPPGRVQVRTRTVQDRLRRSWFRTGMALQLAMDQYSPTDQVENEKNSEMELLQATDS